MRLIWFVLPNAPCEPLQYRSAGEVEYKTLRMESEPRDCERPAH